MVFKKKDTGDYQGRYFDSEEDILPPAVDEEHVEHREFHGLDGVNVGGGPSRAMNFVILGICLFGIIYAIVTIL